ncbi:MAG: ABC transporter ATP-binding protein, partial [Clostridiales bacterium]|nr:ABC transporter ATP-binding protein [Clostridiales bacterium]
SDLSGGERGRVSLAKLMLSEANFLILDAPPNHLDIVSKEILEDALKQYTGTILYVSHDRYFINQTATRILELTGQTFINYIGNYDYYLEKKELLTGLYAPEGNAATASAESENKQSWKTQKEEQARNRKRQNDLKKTEETIAELEERDARIDELLGEEEVYTDVSRLMELNQEKESIQEQLARLYEEWEKLAE